MRISLNWLSSLVDLPTDPQNLRQICDVAGLEVANITDLGARLEYVVVAQIVSAQLLPGTHLQQVKLHCGSHGMLTALSGAPNVTAQDAGRLVATALPGATIRTRSADGQVRDLTVTSREMRGVMSEAVMVSESELGLSDDHTGVLYLQAEGVMASSLEPGTPLAALLGDTHIEFELTPDLGRCFSAFGLARELGALLGTPTHPETLRLATMPPMASGPVCVGIADPDLARRYLGAVIRNVKVAPSPAWMQRRLIAAGMRPINNLVDIANYVMLEMGQPLHFFDLHRLEGAAIEVRRAREGESMVALNGETYPLAPPMLVIADTQGPVAVAGVIGGQASAVNPSTTDVLLEAAHFAPSSVRRTCQTLKLRTDAAERFIKGIDDHTTMDALRRAIQLTLELCPGSTLEGYQDTWPGKQAPPTLLFGPQHVERLLGLPLTADHIASLLAGFGFVSRPATAEERNAANPPAPEGTLHITAPTWRMDVEHPADLTEEVARAYGLNNIPTPDTGIAYLEQTSPDDALVEATRRGAAYLGAQGFFEAINYSLTSNALNAFGADFGRPRPAQGIRLANPLSSERDTLRTTLIPGLLRNLGDNLRYRSGAQLYEFGRAYLPTEGGEHEEVELVALATVGQRRAPYWGHTDPGTAIGPTLGLFDLKGTVESLLHRFAISPVRFEPATLDGLTPGQTMRILAGQEILGYLGEVDAPWLQRMDIDPSTPAFVAELRWAPLAQASAQAVPQFRRLPTQPATLRDLSILVSQEHPVESLLSLVRKEGGGELESVELFDRYRGQGVPEGQHSLAMHLTFQHPTRTLTAAEIDQRMAQIATTLGATYGARLRGV